MELFRIGRTIPFMRNALVLSEDQRFYEHSGVDWQAVAAAATLRLRHHRKRQPRRQGPTQ